MSVRIVLLAAGLSVRFGENKLLYEWEGRPLYRYTFDRLLAVQESCTEVSSFLVVTRYPEIQRYAEEHGVSAALNLHSEEGIASSIRVGLLAGETGAEDFLLFSVADQPYMKSETITDFLHAFLESGRTLGCMKCGERLGNPMIFHKSYEEELLGLAGDTGGKKVMQRHLGEAFFYTKCKKIELLDLDKRFDNKIHGIYNISQH